MRQSVHAAMAAHAWRGMAVTANEKRLDRGKNIVAMAKPWGVPYTPRVLLRRVGRCRLSYFADGVNLNVTVCFPVGHLYWSSTESPPQLWLPIPRCQ